MNKFFPVLLSVALLGFSALAATGDDATSKPAGDPLSDACQNLVDSFAKNDVATLTGLLADDFTLIDFEGKKNDGASLLKAMTDGIIHVQSFRVMPQEVKDWGSSGVVQGPAELQMTYGRDKPTEIKGRFAVTAVFVKQDGRWRLSAAQMTSIKPRPPK